MPLQRLPSIAPQNPYSLSITRSRSKKFRTARMPVSPTGNGNAEIIDYAVTCGQLAEKPGITKLLGLIRKGTAGKALRYVQNHDGVGLSSGGMNSAPPKVSISCLLGLLGCSRVGFEAEVAESTPVKEVGEDRREYPRGINIWYKQRNRSRGLRAGSTCSLRLPRSDNSGSEVVSTTSFGFGLLYVYVLPPICWTKCTSRLYHSTPKWR